MIYSVQDYNITFFVECQGENGSLFYFVRFAQIQSIIYSRLTSKKISFICAFYESLFSNEIIAEKAVLHLVTHHKQGTL